MRYFAIFYGKKAFKTLDVIIFYVTLAMWEPFIYEHFSMSCSTRQSRKMHAQKEYNTKVEVKVPHTKLLRPLSASKKRPGGRPETVSQ